MNENIENASNPKMQHSKKTYLIAFVVCILLTLIPFVLIGYGGENVTKSLKMSVIGLFALLQLIVQIIYFLHLKDNDAWNTGALAFTLVLVGIIVGGSAWIMYNLNVNMMVMAP